MNRADLMLRERNLQAIFDQHNIVNRQLQHGALISIGGVMLLAFALLTATITVSNLFGALLTGFAITGVFYGLVLIVLAGFRVVNLPQVDDVDEPPDAPMPRRPIYEQTTRPPIVRIEHVRDNQTRVHNLDLEMSQHELDEFANAIRSNRDGLLGRYALTKRLIKRRTRIKNIDARYTHWKDELERVEAIEKISGTYYLTDAGKAILDELSPPLN